MPGRQLSYSDIDYAAFWLCFHNFFFVRRYRLYGGKGGGCEVVKAYHELKEKQSSQDV